MRIGVISDTHGLVRPEALAALQGVDHILHAGDLGRGDMLSPLEAIAPVVAIRGNIDREGPAAALPDRETVEIAGARFHIVHDIADLDAAPAEEGWDAVVFGHSHKPGMERRDGVLFLNPGSAGPRRFSLPVTLAIVTVEGGRLEAEIVTLLPR
ncbi:hypothetical protein LX81_01888 [Palleronia aestuarii]|uniref:Phosphoesterase n=1 Tax=Palleronia aestuarii TaxID=568105 RepID=A0A2W7Q4B2_9RHOB|nr:metallophosphoesterase family protein [Palleronia aestuarii]PZX16519.1 hypothetical protein LX81_01888 [Palleronia aestuarii]